MAGENFYGNAKVIEPEEVRMLLEKMGCGWRGNPYVHADVVRALMIIANSDRPLDFNEMIRDIIHERNEHDVRRGYA